MTFEQVFKELSKKFLKKSSKVGDFNAEVCLTDEDCGGTFSIRVANGKVDIEPYDYYEADVRMTCTYENFIKFISDQEATYNMECKSKRFADIIAVVKKQSGKKEEEKPVKTAAKKTSVKSKTEVKDETKTAAAKKTDTAAKKTVTKKTAAKKASAKASSDTKLKTPKAASTEKASSKPEKTEVSDKPAEKTAVKTAVKAETKTAVKAEPDKAVVKSEEAEKKTAKKSTGKS